MSNVIQTDTVKELDHLILSIYEDANIEPPESEMVSTDQTEGQLSLSVAREEGDNLLQLFVGIEGPNGRSLVSVHKIGWYVTGSTVIFDKEGQPESLRQIHEPDLTQVVSIVRDRQEAGVFKPERNVLRSFSDFLTGATFKLSEQEQEWEIARSANESRWAEKAQYGNLLRSIVWTVFHEYLHRGATPEAIMQKEAQALNRQYNLEHSEATV